VFVDCVRTVELHHNDSPPLPFLAAADDLVLRRQYIPHIQATAAADLHDLLFFNRS